jgi:hypothetical protein
MVPIRQLFKATPPTPSSSRQTDNEIRDDEPPREVIRKIRRKRGMDENGDVINAENFQTFKILGYALRM